MEILEFIITFIATLLYNVYFSAIYANLTSPGTSLSNRISHFAILCLLFSLVACGTLDSLALLVLTVTAIAFLGYVQSRRVPTLVCRCFGEFSTTMHPLVGKLRIGTISFGIFALVSWAVFPSIQIRNADSVFLSFATSTAVFDILVVTLFRTVIRPGTSRPPPPSRTGEVDWKKINVIPSGYSLSELLQNEKEFYLLFGSSECRSCISLKEKLVVVAPVLDVTQRIVFVNDESDLASQFLRISDNDQQLAKTLNILALPTLVHIKVRNAGFSIEKIEGPKMILMHLLDVNKLPGA